MLTKQQLELNEVKEATERSGNTMSIKICPWDSITCLDAVISTYVKQVEFIDPHQVVFTHLFSDEEIRFHNDGLLSEDCCISPMFYCSNMD